MSESKSTNEPSTSRRAVVGGVVGAGLGLPLLAACGSSGSSGADKKTDTPSGPVGTTTEVPVGGGKIFIAEKVVVTQPSEGEFKAFSAVCTHQGCVVSEVEGKDIVCGCHGSKFSIEDGSVLGGPATKALPEFKVSTKGTEIRVS